MRITIEVNEADRAVTVHQQAEHIATSTAAPAESSPIDGGSPSDALLLALGAKTDEGGANGRASQAGVNAGEPAKALVDALSARVPIFEVPHREHGG